MIEFAQYSKIKNNYCLCYFGYSDEYLVQLRLIRPLLEQQFPGLNICLGCKDDKVHLLQGCQHVLALSRIKADRNNFAHIRELTFNGRTHPVEDLLLESELTNPIIRAETEPRTTDFAVLVTKGNYPTKSLDTSQIEQLKGWIVNQGYSIDYNCPIDRASLVVGVESVQIFEAAARGVRVILVPTGVGTSLYQKLFPKHEIWDGTRSYKQR